MVKFFKNMFYRRNGKFENNISRFRQINRDWDRLASLMMFALYAVLSLVWSPINVLRNPAIPQFFINLLLFEILIGCITTTVGIVLRLYKPQLIGALIILSAIFIQLIIGVTSDGLSSGDFFIAGTILVIIALVRRVRHKLRQSNEILHIHELVDEAARDIKRDEEELGG